MNFPVKKIAIFRALQLGDMLCIIPTVRAIKAAYRHASLTLIGLPWQKEFAARFHHYFDSFLEFPGWPGLPEQPFDTKKIISFLEEINDREFDIIFQMQGNGTITNSLCMLWGGRKVAGLRRKGGYCPGDEKLFPVSEDSEHEVLRFLKLAEAFDIPLQGYALEFPFFQKEIENFKTILQQLGLRAQEYICLHPGARDPKRRWPADHFAWLGDQFALQGFVPVLTGSESEHSLLKEVENKMQAPVINVIHHIPDLSLGELASILAQSTLLISNDTGVSHIAAALRIPSVIFFSPYSDPNRWAPLDKILHKAVPYVKTKNLRSVLETVLEQLRLAKANATDKSDVNDVSRLRTIR